MIVNLEFYPVKILLKNNFYSVKIKDLIGSSVIHESDSIPSSRKAFPGTVQNERFL